jgi:hypothetical protein
MFSIEIEELGISRPVPDTAKVRLWSTAWERSSPTKSRKAKQRQVKRLVAVWDLRDFTERPPAADVNGLCSRNGELEAVGAR